MQGHKKRGKPLPAMRSPRVGGQDQRLYRPYNLWPGHESAPGPSLTADADINRRSR